MKPRSSEYTAHQIECKKKFSALTESEQLMVELLAFYYTRTSAADLARMLRQLFANTGNNYTFTTQVVMNIFGGLAQKGFVIIDGEAISCHDEYLEVACRNAVLRKHVMPILNAIKGVLKASYFAPGQPVSMQYYSEMRRLRLDLFSGSIFMLPEHVSGRAVDPDDALLGMPLFCAAMFPFEADWFECLPVICQTSIFRTAMQFTRVYFCNFPELVEYFSDRRWLKSDAFWRFGALPMAEYQLLKGDFELALLYAEMSQEPEAGAIVATVELLQGNKAGALDLFARAIRANRKSHGRNGGCFDHLGDFFYLVALLAENTPASTKKAEDLVVIANRSNSFLLGLNQLMTHLQRFRTGSVEAFASFEQALGAYQTPLAIWLAAFVFGWVNGLDQQLLPTIRAVSEIAGPEGLSLPYCEFLRLRSELGEKLSAGERRLLGEWLKTGCVQISRLLEARAQWQIVLDSLKNVLVPDIGSDESERMLTWSVSYLLLGSEIDTFIIEPREKIRLKSGRWSAGKVLDINVFNRENPDFPEYFTAHDRRLVRHFIHHRARTLTYNERGFNEALLMLAGHPQIYDTKSRDRVSIEVGEPMLVVGENDGLYEMRFQPEYAGSEIIVVEESVGFLRVYSFSELQIKTARLLQASSHFPGEAKEQLAAAVTALSRRMPVHSNIEGAENLTSVETVPCCEELFLQLQPLGDGLSLKVRVRPFGSFGPAMLPAQGMHDVYTRQDERKLHATRDFAREEQSFDMLVGQVPMLAGMNSENPEVVFADPEQALELLLQLNDISGIIIEWPEKASVKRVRTVSFDRLRMRIEGSQNWFALDGQLAVDEDEIVDLQKLLQLYSAGGSRFVQIGEGEFIALTEDFRRRLNDIYSFSESQHGQLRVHQLALPALEDALAGQPNIVFDERWRKVLQRLKNADKLEFSVPTTLTADLREYQIEAFRWLCRMDYLSMGACLADDMGLGKTVEALALLVHKAAKGPALVVAPTSVCMNWFEEVHRFAPTLNPVIFAQSQRRETLSVLGAFDLVICSYGIMQREIEMLSEIKWETVILDEAQAIKNMATVRSKAAMALQGNFRLIMTGTPIENHLGELWNLFRFINPGLLGSVESFNARFANPIQSGGDKFVQRQLKRLLQPFVMRRTKNQVLQDLPPRTEIMLRVELSKDETALYESMRRQAVSRLSDIDAGAGQKHIMILAELMKLRRLCCNPFLVAPELNIASSKLSLFESIVDELLENRHKALVFSQFVDHLTIVRELLDKKGIKYQYLDGSTPARTRTRSIKDFQAGEGDLFLISLKAGGLGLNLTAADYVIHLDPWWNPAVEDQASDRAHRIGQQRPVTIYRLITSGTIEEKIVALHHKKRELADSLLEGTEMAGRVSTAELLALLRETSLS
ncbi:MAG: DEAD/DEAH box helicase [Candidatus Riflebacteria bacterium]|nr:DEAD/DEAH box helicase [Candidatus Riflebacteria bacterium]